MIDDWVMDREAEQAWMDEAMEAYLIEIGVTLPDEETSDPANADASSMCT